MDWDDEEEKTQVFDKSPDEDDTRGRPLPAAGTPPPPTASSAAALLQRSGNVAGPMHKGPTVTTPKTAVPGPPMRAVTAAEPTLVTPPKDSSRNRTIGIIAAVVAIIIVAVFFLYPSSPATGSLKVYVFGPGGRDVGTVDIYVNDSKVCSTSPCTVDDLKVGLSHDVKVEAPGFQRLAPKGYNVEAGKQIRVEIELAGLADGEQAPPVSGGTGFMVSSRQPGIKLIVDDRAVGTLPQTLRNLSPGAHKLRFEGSDRYAPVEKTVTVTAGQMTDLGDIKLTVVKGTATLRLVTRGARILLVVPSTGEKRIVDESSFTNNEISIGLDTSKEWTLEATKAGFEDLKIPISFADGEAEKTFSIELVERGRAINVEDLAPKKTPTPSQPASKPTSAPASTGTTKPAATGAAPATGNATLNFNSIPPSNVVLDGRPIGSTPKMGVSVSPGSHTVMFVHPEHGRKSTSVTVKAGETKPVTVRF